jgi:hypothetical protein
MILGAFHEFPEDNWSALPILLWIMLKCALLYAPFLFPQENATRSEDQYIYPSLSNNNWKSKTRSTIKRQRILVRHYSDRSLAYCRGTSLIGFWSWRKWVIQVSKRLYWFIRDSSENIHNEVVGCAGHTVLHSEGTTFGSRCRTSQWTSREPFVLKMHVTYIQKERFVL